MRWEFNAFIEVGEVTTGVSALLSRIFNFLEIQELTGTSNVVSELPFSVHTPLTELAVLPHFWNYQPNRKIKNCLVYLTAKNGQETPQKTTIKYSLS